MTITMVLRDIVATGRPVFSMQGPIQWGGHYAMRSAEVAKRLNEDVSDGDVIVAYQTDLRAVVGYLRITRIDGPVDDKKLYLQPTYRVDPPFPIHDHKAGTSLAGSPAVNGPLMLWELSKQEKQALVRLTGAPKRILSGKEPEGGWRL